MKYFLTLTLSLSASALFSLSLAGADGLAGVWSGEYHFSGDGNKDEKVHFSLVARHEDQSALFEGRIQEPNTFGDKEAIVLEADVHGIVDPDGKVQFVKTYDGHGEEKHSVWYSGKLSDDKKSISGKWYMSDSWGGEFSLSYVDKK